ncbi:ArsR/SmtB family transcription factor [[Mycobacterium] nativiensis]|uniref:Metalloregulator ArsR/SmtB family transcription factor n=1 Tax=[Mycobacterium] nativiensis TaxID=2855503 RepID=A0ABU5XUW6_9MYCO|nr:metalloregulator ArsR/SmtB family transcription factor [Mycolicibacter sp. MYC340]MEB3031713.1 metalloregulator ArsR/SmtB family transcription factor [Mycolicibacter sp. MYC340]
MAKQEEREPEHITSPGRPDEPTQPQLSSAASTFGLLSSPARLHVMWLATQGAYDVTTLAGRAGINIATMSQHLTKLRLAGLISARKDGRHHIYTVDDPHIVTLLQQIFAHIAPDGTLAPDPPAGGTHA